MQDIEVLLIGIGGYGENYIQQFLETGVEHARLVAVVDPCAKTSPYFEAIQATNIEMYENTAAFYATEQHVDLVVISSPIHTHYKYILEALRYGCNVLCEKPVVFDLKQLDALIKAEKESGHFVAVGYQQCYLDSVRSLKADIQAGIFGSPLKLKALRLMRRGDRYYSRNNWAGKRTCHDQFIYDSPLSNACAHQIHTLLFLLGATERSAAEVDSVEGCTYKARPTVENFDAIALKVHTSVGVPIFYYTAHCVAEAKIGPMGELLFEKARIMFEGDTFTALLEDGSKKNYGGDEKAPKLQKLFVAVSCCLDGTIPPCTLESVRSHSEVVLLADGLGITDHPDAQYLEIEGDGTYVIPNLSKAFVEAYNAFTLPRLCDYQAQA